MYDRINMSYQNNLQQKNKTLILLILLLLGAIIYVLFIFFHRCILLGRCPVKTREERDQIVITLESSKRLYNPEEIIGLQASIMNKRSEPAKLFPSGDKPAIELTYRTKQGVIFWHDQHQDIAYNQIIIEPAGMYQIEIIIPPEDQPITEGGQLCISIMVNYPGGWDGGYGIGDYISYNNRRY